MSSEEGACLVARAVPCAIKDPAEELASQLDALKVDAKTAEKPKPRKTVDNISPADFVSLQSIRSSALAKKTNTTSKFIRNGAVLFDDLLNKPKKEDEEKKKDEKAEEKKEEEKEELKDQKEDEGALIERGPVTNSRAPIKHHPYASLPYGTAAQSQVEDISAYSAYGAGYECGSSWLDSPEQMGYYVSNSSTPDTVHSDAGYHSACSPPFTDNQMTAADLNRLLDSSELPDPLADFILKYSRRYSNGENKVEENRSSSPNDSPPGSQRPMSTDSGCESPMSAGSAPQRSPAAPRGAFTQLEPLQSQTTTAARKPLEGSRPAKERLRSMISEAEMDVAWAWTCKCVQYVPGQLAYQDNDRDTLLHIVTNHLDYAKIYALTEQQLKRESGQSPRFIDHPNRNHETPLFLAVEKRCLEVVNYFLEIGADPNHQTLRPERDASLHHAAARGMTDIVQALCSSSATDLNQQNGMGLTSLLCAVKNHGVIEEASQCIINNKPTIRALLKAGADPLIADATNGKTVIHYAVERMDPDLIDIFKNNLDESVMSDLVNKGDLSLETPMHYLEALSGQQDEALRKAIFLNLLTCGANMAKSPRSQSNYY